LGDVTAALAATEDRQDSLEMAFLGRAIANFCPWRGPLLLPIFGGSYSKFTVTAIELFNPLYSISHQKIFAQYVGIRYDVSSNYLIKVTLLPEEFAAN
jgi:hypothetical protein